ncbi:MAG: DUF2452 domain-containing protein [Saprospiraceae bacterium]|nr:DUF2452 domain-containing protein [Saprospiraceae bacterium]
MEAENNLDKEIFFNPISSDKITENPGLLPYAHHVGSAIIRPLDKGKTKGNAMKAMYQQTGNQLTQIKDQVELLIKQAQQIHDRINISELIYKADCGVKPVVGETYFLYEKAEDSYLISLISPEEWGQKMPYHFIAEVNLLADHTWNVVRKLKDITI